MSDHPTISFDESNNIRVLSDQHMQVNFLFYFLGGAWGCGVKVTFLLCSHVQIYPCNHGHDATFAL